MDIDKVTCMLCEQPIVCIYEEIVMRAVVNGIQKFVHAKCCKDKYQPTEEEFQKIKKILLQAME